MKINKTVLITTPLHFLPFVVDDMRKKFDCIMPTHDKESIIKCIHNADAWICQPCPEYKIDKSILEHADKLRVIASTSTGTNHIDAEYCKENNIQVVCLKNHPSVSKITASSEFTFALMLATMRKLPHSFEYAKGGQWRDVEDKLRGVEIAGKTLGIIGYGRIGSNNSRYANAFGMRVIAYDPFIDILGANNEQKETYDEVLGQADVVMICVHLDANTNNMVDASWFSKMKDGVYFINTSRGEIVNEDDMIDALESGKVKAAGLDVIANEVDKHKIDRRIIKYAQAHDNLIITPHIAGLTYDSERKAANIITDEVYEILRGQK